VVGVLITFSPEISGALNIQGEVKPGQAIAFAYLGITFGAYASGHFSQLLGSRRKVLLAFILFTALAVTAYFLCRGLSSGTFYLVILLIGFGVGYWTLFVTVAAEQFGTNIRATVATTVPNFVRGATVPLTLAFKHLKPHTGVINSAAIVSAASIALALWAVWGMEETHGKDLDYIETT
jgi:MFS transporter, putative metabolite:H+ symporter